MNLAPSCNRDVPMPARPVGIVHKRPVQLNRPRSDVNRCIEVSLGAISEPPGPPGGDDADSEDLRRALGRYYHALSVHQGDALVELEKRFDVNLRNLSEQYERRGKAMDSTDRELCVLIQRQFQRFEDDLRYHARAGYEVMGVRLAGRLAGSRSVTTLVEVVLQWWRNPRDRKYMSDVRAAVDALILRRARGSLRRMQENRAKVEHIKRSMTGFSGNVIWSSCLENLGLETDDLHMALLFVAAAEGGWRIEAGDESNEFAVDLGANRNSNRCVLFPVPLPASVNEELHPVVSIKSLNEEVYGLLTGDRWFALHSTDVIGTVVAVRYVEVDEHPMKWVVIERRHNLEISVLTAKDCAWLSQLLCGDAVDEVVTLYENLTRHAQRGHLPDGREVGVSVVEFRSILERKGILTTAGVTGIVTAQTASTMFSLTGNRKWFSKALAELVLGAVTPRTIVRSTSKRLEIVENVGEWCFKVSGAAKRLPKDLETVITSLIRQARKRGICCRLEGATIFEDVEDVETLGATRGRIGLTCHDLWYSRYEIPARLDSPEA